MAERKQAVVIGALGVIGRYIVERLLREGDWSVIGLSRRPTRAAPRYHHIQVDLLDAADTAAKLAGLTDTTHVFYAAFQPAAGAAAGYASNIAPNRDMLVNAVTAIHAASPALRRVVLVTGTKYYGFHLGPSKTPARESDPRHEGPNYYFDQIDWLTDIQRGKSWDWVELRPQTLCGFAPGTAMSLAPAIRLRGDHQGVGAAAALPGQARCLYVALSGHRVGALRQRGAVGGERAPLRAPGLQHHQRRLFPLAAHVAGDCTGVRHAGRRAAPDEPHRRHGRQGAAVARHGGEARPEGVRLRGAGRVAVCRLRVRLRLGT